MKIDERNLADTTIRNVEEIREAGEMIPTSEIDRQEQYVAGHGDRCIRCGDLSYGLWVGSTPFCDTCMDHLRELDRKFCESPVQWFSEFVQRIRQAQAARRLADSGGSDPKAKAGRRKR